MKKPAGKLRPSTRHTLRALGGRHIVIEGFGGRSPAFVAIAGGSDAPIGAWVSPTELKRFVEAARRILK